MFIYYPIRNLFKQWDVVKNDDEEEEEKEVFILGLFLIRKYFKKQKYRVQESVVFITVIQKEKKKQKVQFSSREKEKKSASWKKQQ